MAEASGQTEVPQLRAKVFINGGCYRIPRYRYHCAERTMRRLKDGKSKKPPPWPRGGPQRRGVNDGVGGVRPFAYPITYAARKQATIRGFPEAGRESPFLGAAPHGLWTLRGLGCDVRLQNYVKRTLDPWSHRTTAICAYDYCWINEAAHGTLSPVRQFLVFQSPEPPLIVSACHG